MLENNFLTKLLDGQKIEWKSLGEVAEKISSGGTPKTGVAEYYDGDIPWLRTQEVDFNEIYNTGVKITEAGLKNSSAKWIPKNCVIIAMYGATVGKIGINKIPMATNQACANIQLNKNKISYRFVFHFLSMQYEYIKSLGSGSQTNINAGIVKKLQIPIPCPENPAKSLEIQQKIVTILDKFTELTTQLTTELAAELQNRKKQYSYYRDKLLTFNDDEVEWKILGEVCSYEQPTKYIVKSKEYNNKNKTPVLTAGKTFILGYTDEENGICKSSINPVIIFDDFTTANKWVDFDFKVKSSAMKILSSFDNDKFILKYIYYWISNLPKKIDDNDHKRQWIGIYSKKLIPIPCPENPKKSLEIQQKIVNILDKFDSLTNSISEGLPKEIELRQKQYEYYRDLLLNFPKEE